MAANATSEGSATFVANQTEYRREGGVSSFTTRLVTFSKGR